MALPELYANPATPGVLAPLATLTQAITTTPAAGTQESYTVSAAAPTGLRTKAGWSSGVGQFHVLIDNELMVATASSTGGSPWTFTRGADQSPIQTHGSGASIYLVVTAGILNHLEYAAMRVVDVRDYGAVGDGGTDDTTAIQNAINDAARNSSKGGGIVYLPAATYLISRALLLYYGVQLVGAGSHSVTIKANASIPLSSFQNGANGPNSGPRIDPAATTNVAAASNGVNVSTFTGAGTLNVVSTANQATSGSVRVDTSTGSAYISYTGITATTLTGCTTTSGTGVLATGGAVASRVVPALIRWDGGDQWAHGVHVEGMTLDTNGIPGLSGMWIEDTGEGSWFNDVSCSSCAATNRTVSNAQLVAGSNAVTLTKVPTLLASANAAGGGTQVATMNTTGATLLVITIGGTGGTPTVSDSLGNAWTVIGGNATYMAYAWQKAGGGPLATSASHTLTVTTNVDSVWFGAYSNTQSTADPLDASYEAYTGAGLVNISPQAVTPTQAYDLAVSMFAGSDGTFTPASVDSGFNIVYTSDFTGGTHYGNVTATKIATDTNPIKPTWTATTAADFSVATVLFKAAPALDVFTEEDVNAILSFGGSVPAPAAPALTAHYQLSAPAAPAPTTAATGGTVAAGTYKVATTFVNALGETVASAQGTVTTTGTTSTITVPFPASPPADATGWYAYVSQAGGSTLTRQQAAGSPTGVATNFVLTAPPTSTGAAPPASNTTGGSLTSGTTYTVGLTYLTANGETAVSTTTAVTPSGTSPYITVTSPAAPTGGGATGWFAYVNSDPGIPLLRSQAPGAATAVGTNYQLKSYPATGAATPYRKIDRIDWAVNSHDAQHSTAIMRGPAAATLSNISFTVARPTDAFIIQGIGTPGNVGQLHGVLNSGALLRTRGGSGDIKQLSGDDNVGGMFRWSGGAWGADMALINIHSIKAESDTYNANWQYSMDPVILLDRCFTVALNVYGGTYLGGAYVRDVVRLDNNFTSTLAPSPSVLLAGVEGQNWYNPQYANIIHDTSTGDAIPTAGYNSSPAYPVILWNREQQYGGLSYALPGSVSKKLCMPSGGDDTANINRAIANNQELGIGTFNVSGVINGYPRGQGPKTILQATAVGARIQAGPALPAGPTGDSGVYGNFVFDGKFIATGPLLTSNTVQTTLINAVVQNGLGDAVVVCGQNNTFINVDFGNCTGCALVLDGGAGGNTFFNFEIGSAQQYHIEFRETFAASTYLVPSNNVFIGGRTEYGYQSTTGSNVGCVHVLAGNHNHFIDCDFDTPTGTRHVYVEQNTVTGRSADYNSHTIFEECAFTSGSTNLTGCIESGSALMGGDDICIILRGNNTFSVSASVPAILWSNPTNYVSLEGRYTLYVSVTNLYTATGSGTYLRYADTAGFVVLLAPRSSAAIDTANLNAAIAAAGSGGTILAQPGTYQLNAQVTIPSGVNLRCAGSAQGGDTHSATVFQCTTAGAGLWFKGDGSTSGNFIIDGNNVATQPFLRGDSSAGSQRQFESVVVRASAQDNMKIQYSQNDTYINCVCTGAVRDNLVFDAGTGGHIFINHENANHGRYGIYSQQTVNTVATLYSEPAQIQFIGGRTEGGTSATGAAVQIDNGYHITFDDHDLNHGTGAVTAIANVTTASTANGQGNTGRIIFRDVWFTGGAASSNTLHIGANANAVIDGGEASQSAGVIDLVGGLTVMRNILNFNGPMFSAATTAAAIAGINTPGPGDWGWNGVVPGAITGNITNTSTAVTNLSTALPVGAVYGVSGTGIPAGATLTITGPPTVGTSKTGTLSAAATATTTGVALTIGLQNGWLNTGSPFPNFRYRKDGQGFIHPEGLIQSGTQTAGTVIWTFPVGARPAASKIYTCPVNNTGGTVTMMIASNGQLTIQGATNPAGSLSWIDLGVAPFLAEN